MGPFLQLDLPRFDESDLEAYYLSDSPERPDPAYRVTALYLRGRQRLRRHDRLIHSLPHAGR